MTIGKRRETWGVNVKGISVAVLALFLSSCEFFRVATFNDHEGSLVREAESFQAQLIRPGNNGVITLDDSSDPQNTCGIPLSEDEKPADLKSLMFSTAIAGLIVAGAGLAIDSGFDAIEGYIEKEIEKFKHTYAPVALNIAELDFNPNQIAPNGKRKIAYCLLLTRTVEISVNGKPDRQTAFELSVAFVQLSKQAFYMKPVFGRMCYAGARTGSDSASVDVNVSIGISVPVRAASGPKTTLLAFREFELPQVEIVTGCKSNPTDNKGDAQSSLRFRMFERPKTSPSTFKSPGPGEIPKSKFSESSLFPSPQNSTSATIVVSVTETGSGAKDFGKVKSKIGSSRAALKKLAIDKLTEFLGEQ